MKTIDVRFNINTSEYGSPRYASKIYAYLVTDEQAREIASKKIEYAVVQAPGEHGAMKVVQITGDPSDKPQRASRYIVSLVDVASYRDGLAKAEAVRKVRARMEQRAREIAEEARLKALAETGDPEMARLWEEMKQLQD